MDSSLAFNLYDIILFIEEIDFDAMLSNSEVSNK